jgi:hypothetical protein
VLKAHQTREVVPPSRRSGVEEVPFEIDEVILHCLNKRPEDRYPSMVEVAKALRGTAPKTDQEPFEEELTQRWKVPPELEQRELPLPESPARLRQLFYDTLLKLAEHLVSQEVANEKLVYLLNALSSLKEEAAIIAARNSINENRFEDIRRELRERESTLRYAIIDLNLALADINERDGVNQGQAEIDTHIAELEQNLIKLEEQRTERFAALNHELELNREKLKAMEQEMASYYRRIYAYLDEARLEVSTKDTRQLYRLLERCRAALTNQTPIHKL